jgi:protein O-GlcNAc transferase
MAVPQAQALLQQALAHHQAGRFAAALPLYARARSLAPGSFEAHHLGGAAALQAGRHEEASLLLAKALRLNPRVALTHMWHGMALAQLGQHGPAESSLRKSLELDAKNVDAWTNLGAVNSFAGKIADALNAYRQASALKPRDAKLHSQIGTLLHIQQDHAGAIAQHSAALSLDPNYAKAYLGRAQARLSSHHPDEALADFDACLACTPADLEARSYRLMLLNYLSEISREKLFAEHLEYGRFAESVASVAPTFHKHRDPHKRRLAFISPDLRTHSVAYFLEPLLQHIDRTRFEIILYHDHFVTDATSERLRGQASLWRNFVGKPHTEVAMQISADEPDILVDLAGHTGMNRLPIFAQRVAPVQISYLGYPNTTGLSAMDYRFTDAIADPPGDSDALHTEKLIRFAPCAWTYQPPPDAPAPVPPPCSQENPFTFGSFNNLSKVNDLTLRLWASVLRAVPGSRLMLKSFGLDPVHLRARLVKADLDPDRVMFLPPTTTTAEHLACYHRMDVALDTFPYHGTTTTCEALWMGVPVITLRGDRHASRVGCSLLNASGHPEWIAQNVDDYVRIALQFSRSPETLAAIRPQLRSELMASTLMNHLSHATAFAEAIARL